ncbi:MAG: hypothetical protein UHK54_04735 [Acutalibacteraceae bacterium]|nr:hypothetical protein [Acutalibacteraceae bacterium]
MTTSKTAKKLFDSTSGKLYFMLKSIFDSEDTVEGIMVQAYNDIFNASANPTETDIYIRTAVICFGILGKPDHTNTTIVPIENVNIQSFFSVCENFEEPISNETVAVIDILNDQINVLTPLSKLIVFLRMYINMTPAEIASLAGTDENIIDFALFSAYRTMMPAAVQACSGTPQLHGQPMLQLIRIALLKQAFNTKVPVDIEGKTFSVPSADTVPSAVPVTVEETAVTEEPIINEEPAPVMEDISSGSDPTPAFDSSVWSYIKNKFGFDVSDDANAKLSEAYSLISDGRTDSAKEILFSINREAPHAASLLGLLMIDVGAVTPDDMFNIPADYANLPTFKGANYYANSQLKDFLNKLILANRPTQPPVKPIPPVPSAPPEEKKSKTGLIVTIVIIVALLAIGGVLALAFSQGWISLPDFDNKKNEDTSEVVETDTLEDFSDDEEPTTEEPETTLPSVPQINLGTTTAKIDRAVDNKFEFIPAQSGYYTFSSADDSIDLNGTLFSGSNRIATDTDSGNGQNFMLTVYCDADTPFTLSVMEKARGNGNMYVDITVTMCNDSEGQAYARYTEYTTNGIKLTTGDTLYFDHSFDSNSTMPQQEYIISPTDYYIDQSEGILWLAFPSEYNGQAQNLWYPVRY